LSLLAFDRVACIRGGRLLFEDLSFALLPGEALRHAGPNGSGKSSLIRLAAGLLTPAGGTIIRTAPVALADDAIALDRDRTLGDALGWWAKGEPLITAIDAFALTDLPLVPVRLLSTGQLRRACLARVMASAAPLWLLDEPLNGLDEDGTARLTHAIAAHRASGGAVLAASHIALGGDWRTLDMTP
jgi:heme exporter protein A